MTSYALLNNVAHKDIRVLTERSAELGDAVMSAMVFPYEFRSIQAYYPILLQQDGQGNLYPVAVFGFQEGENLYLNDQGWDAGYIPAMMLKEPFLIGFQKSESAEDRRMLSIDMDHPRVSKDQGEPLFQPLGGRTPYLEQAADLLETIYQGYEHAKHFMGLLKQHQLTESVNVEITLKNGSQHKLVGYHGISEERLQQLNGEALAELSQKGALMPLFMMLASLSNLSRLIDYKNRQTKNDD